MEATLAAAFHAHAAVTPGDWRHYGEMCILARDVYGLSIPLPQLPPQPEEEGGAPLPDPTGEGFRDLDGLWKKGGSTQTVLAR